MWVVCDDVKLDPANPAPPSRRERWWSGAVLLCGGDDGRGTDIMTTELFQDATNCTSSSPSRKGSNSGVYNRGLFEIQVFDSCGVKHPRSVSGVLYERAFPKENLAKPPGVWQSYDIKLVGKSLTLVWNGKPVYVNHDVRYGETDREAFERLNQENRSKPPASRSSFARRTASSSARLEMEAPAPAWTAPIAPDRFSFKAITDPSRTETCESGRSWRIQIRIIRI